MLKALKDKIKDLHRKPESLKGNGLGDELPWALNGKVQTIFNHQLHLVDFWVEFTLHV